MSFRKTVFIGVNVLGRAVSVERPTGQVIVDNLDVDFAVIPVYEDGQVKRLDKVVTGKNAEKVFRHRFPPRFIYS